MKKTIRHVARQHRLHFNTFAFLFSFPSAPASASALTSLTSCRRLAHRSCHHPSLSSSAPSPSVIHHTRYNTYTSQFTPRSFSSPAMTNPPASPQQPTSASLNSKPSVTPSHPSQTLNELWLPHRSDPSVPIVGSGNDWISPIYDSLKAARDFRPLSASRTYPPRILILYGTLRPGGFSKLLA